jgi:hypothetical protein
MLSPPTVEEDGTKRIGQDLCHYNTTVVSGQHFTSRVRHALSRLERIELGLLHSLLTVIASEAKQSPSAELGVASSLSLLATTDFAATLRIEYCVLDIILELRYTTFGSFVLPGSPGCPDFRGMWEVAGDR